MKQTLAALAPYLAVLAADFYLLPLLIRDTGSAMVLLLAVMPLAAFFSAVHYGMRRGFLPWLSVAALLLFLPSVFLYYNVSAWVYGVFYALAVLAGTGLGSLFRGRR